MTPSSYSSELKKVYGLEVLGEKTISRNLNYIIEIVLEVIKSFTQHKSQPSNIH